MGGIYSNITDSSALSPASAHIVNALCDRYAVSPTITRICANAKHTVCFGLTVYEERKGDDDGGDEESVKAVRSCRVPSHETCSNVAHRGAWCYVHPLGFGECLGERGGGGGADTYAEIFTQARAGTTPPTVLVRIDYPPMRWSTGHLGEIWCVSQRRVHLLDVHNIVIAVAHSSQCPVATSIDANTEVEAANTARVAEAVRMGEEGRWFNDPMRRLPFDTRVAMRDGNNLQLGELTPRLQQRVNLVYRPVRYENRDLAHLFSPKYARYVREACLIDTLANPNAENDEEHIQFDA